VNLGRKVIDLVISRWLNCKKEIVIMLPQFLYDALPYIYLGTGALAAISIANTLAIISGVIFVVTAIYIFQLRGTFIR